MSKLDTAMERFGGALDRLEAALGRHAVRSKSSAQLRQEIEALRDDRARLAEELDVMKAEVRRLGELNERTSRRLGKAIDGIRGVLTQG